MAEQNQTGANLDELTGKTEQFIEDNSRNLMLAIAAIAVVIVAIVGYGKFIVEPAETAANEDAWRAEQYFMMDSVDLALNGDGLYPAFTTSRTTTTAPSTARAQYEIGLILRGQRRLRQRRHRGLRECRIARRRPVHHRRHQHRRL